MFNWRLILILLAGLTSTALYAKETGELKSDRQKLSYALGQRIAQSLSRQGVMLDGKAFSLAVEDYLGDRNPRLPEEEIAKLIEKEKSQRKAQVADAIQSDNTKDVQTGRALLTENKNKPDIHVSPGGVQYRVLTEGKGAKPKLSDLVTINFRGTDVNGTVFQSTYDNGRPQQLKPSAMMKGMQDVLPLMPEGSKWQIYVPPSLGYGETGAGPVIGPNEVMIVELELLAVNPSSDAVAE